jgi:succinoglycan biosynthesis transport protein ExoP
VNDICEQNDNLNGGLGMASYATPMSGVRTGDSLFHIAWQGKWFILLSALLGLGGAYLYLQMLVKLAYTSTSRVLVERPLSQRPVVDIMQPGMTATNFLQQQTSIMLSRQIVSQALNSPQVLSLSTLTGSRLQEVVHTLTAKVGKDDVINVTASSEDPNQAAVIVNAVVTAYIEWQDNNKRISTSDLFTTLSAQLDKTTKDLEKKRQEVVTAAERIGLVESTQGGIASKTLDIVNQELATARLLTTQKESYYNRLVKLEADPNRLREYVWSQSPGAENGERIRLADALREARLQLEGLSAGRTVPKSEITLQEKRVKELAQRIVEFDKEFARKQVTAAKNLWEDAKAREDELSRLRDEELAQLQKASGQGSQHELRKAEYTMLENQYNTLLGKINSLDLNADLGGLSIHVLEAAVPGMSAPSQTARVLGIGLVLGLMVGGGLAFVQDWRDQRVRSAEEITASLGVPILGAVPKIARRGILRRKPTVRLASQSPESEAFRSIRTALLFGSAGGQAKTFLITSPGPLEGKTTLVSNLGIAMAQTGKKTLIVDADLRKPKQQRIFVKTGHGKGFVDVLAGTTTLDEAIRPTEIPGLEVLESGGTVPNPSELLGSEAFWAFFEQLECKYDQILVDSPPVGIIVDAQILAARCGLTLLVVRAQKSLRGTTQRARNALSIVGARVVGAVVNDVSKRDMRYSHYSSGGYNYYYGNHYSDVPSAALKELPVNIKLPLENGVSTPSEKQHAIEANRVDVQRRQ